MSRRSAVLAAAVLGGASALHAGSAFDEVIAPILQVRCAECHGEAKQKAKLALHTWDALQLGSDAGPVIVAGKPDESSLLQRLRLPLDDEEHMPPADHAQPEAAEVELIARWLAAGASRTATLGELQLSPALAQAAAALPAKLAEAARAHVPAEPAWEFDAAAVAAARAPLAQAVAELQRRYPGALNYESRTSAALQFTAAGFGRMFGDADLARLAAVREELVGLDLSGTALTDAAAETLATFTRLRVLRAGGTEVGDATAAAVARLPALESLALNDTRVTAASVSALGRLRTLRALRLAGTPAAAAAQAANLPVTPSAAELIPPVEPELPKPAAP